MKKAKRNKVKQLPTTVTITIQGESETLDLNLFRRILTAASIHYDDDLVSHLGDVTPEHSNATVQDIVQLNHLLAGIHTLRMGASAA